jgi:hypothetical protein
MRRAGPDLPLGLADALSTAERQCVAVDLHLNRSVVLRENEAGGPRSALTPALGQLRRREIPVSDGVTGLQRGGRSANRIGQYGPPISATWTLIIDEVERQAFMGSQPRRYLTDWRYSHSMASLSK